MASLLSHNMRTLLAFLIACAFFVGSAIMQHPAFAAPGVVFAFISLIMFSQRKYANAH